jgi:hypothetical protein
MDDMIYSWSVCSLSLWILLKQVTNSYVPCKQEKYKRRAWKYMAKFGKTFMKK